MRGRRVWLVAVVMACVAAVLVAVFWSHLPFVSAARTGPVAVSRQNPCDGPGGSHSLSLSPVDSILKCESVSGLKDSLARQILADGKVSAEEWQASRGEYVSCMSKAGLIDISVANDGQVTAGSPPGMSLETLDKIQGDCQDSAHSDFGDIDFIFQQQKTNPDNLSTEELIQQEVSCLVKARLLPKGTSVNDFIKLKSFPGDTSPVAMKCMGA